MNLTDAMLRELNDRIARLEARVAQLEGPRPGTYVPSQFVTEPIVPAWPPFADPKLY